MAKNLSQEIKEPKYIILYHAIDWLAGIVDSPSPILMHEELALKESKFGAQKLHDEKRLAIQKINSQIKSNKLRIFGKPIYALHEQAIPVNSSETEFLLDYPDYEINLAEGIKKSLSHTINIKKPINRLPPKHDDEEFHEFFLDKPICSPSGYSTLKVMQDYIRESDWLSLNLNLISIEYRNFYVFEKEGFRLSYGNQGDYSPQAKGAELLYFEVSELRNLFFSNQSRPKTKKAGRPKLFFPEMSLLVFLEEIKEEQGDSDRALINEYLEKIEFSELRSSFETGGQLEKERLLDKLCPEDDKLTTILSELISTNINLSKIFSAKLDYFRHLVGNNYGGEKKLQLHYQEIRSCFSLIINGFNK